MKKTALFLACAALLCCVLWGCAAPAAQANPSAGMQIVADRSYAAKEYANGLFAALMEEQDYTIEQTAYGAKTSEMTDSLYLIGYLYRVDGSLQKYGYKIHVDNDFNCTLREEGAEIAAVLFS